MTQQLATTNTPTDEQVRAVAATLSPDQVAILLRSFMPQVQSWSALESTLEGLANRLAGNGLTADMAAHWAKQVASAFEADGRDAAKSLVNDLTSHFHANPVSASEAKAWELEIRSVLEELTKPDATVIDTTAVRVPEPMGMTTLQGRQP